MTESASGLILRVRPLTETSLIIHWLTPEWGRIATVAKGARRPKSPFAGRLDLFYVADFSFSRSRRSSLHNLREVKLRETHGAIRADMTKLQQAGYAAAFIEQTTETDTPLPEVFRLTSNFLKLLCEQKTSSKNIFALELKLLRELGLMPDLTAARLTPGAKKLVTALVNQDWPSAPQLQLSRTQSREVGAWLEHFLLLQLGRLPRGRATVVVED